MFLKDNHKKRGTGYKTQTRSVLNLTVTSSTKILVEYLILFGQLLL